MRPVLTLAMAEMFGATARRGRSTSPARVELVHACSLVLDDLPAMDDARLRRGRRTTHLEFGEDVAILAAFALLNRGYALVAEASRRLPLSRYTAEDLLHHLAAAIGSEGLIGGQALDLPVRPRRARSPTSSAIHSRKTGALFVAAAELGAMAADARRKELEAVSALRQEPRARLPDRGRPGRRHRRLRNSRARTRTRTRGKATFVALLGIDGARALADELLDFAEASLAPFGRRADGLKAISELVRGYGRLGGDRPAPRRDPS